MDRTPALLLVLAAGAVIAFQSPTNRALGSHIGNLRAALVNFAVGGIVLLVIVMVFAGGLSGIASDPVRWHYLGGLFGVLFVTTAIVTLAPLGITMQTVAVIAAQLTAAVVIDYFGLLGLERRPLGVEHLIGIALLGAGVVVLARA